MTGCHALEESPVMWDDRPSVNRFPDRLKSIEDSQLLLGFLMALTSNGADHPFDQWILPRGARCGKDLLHPETVDASIEVRSVDLISIPSCAKTQPF